MNANCTVDIQLTEAAAAVARIPRLQHPPHLQWSQLLALIQAPDLVMLPPCSTPLVVLFRKWTLAQDSLVLTIVLGLPDEPPKLKAM